MRFLLGYMWRASSLSLSLPKRWQTLHNTKKHKTCAHEVNNILIISWFCAEVLLVHWANPERQSPFNVGNNGAGGRVRASPRISNFPSGFQDCGHCSLWPPTREIGFKECTYAAIQRFSSSNRSWGIWSKVLVYLYFFCTEEKKEKKRGTFLLIWVNTDCDIAWCPVEFCCDAFIF